MRGSVSMPEHGHRCWGELEREDVLVLVRWAARIVRANARPSEANVSEHRAWCDPGVGGQRLDRVVVFCHVHLDRRALAGVPRRCGFEDGLEPLEAAIAAVAVLGEDAFHVSVLSKTATLTQ